MVSCFTLKNSLRISGFMCSEGVYYHLYFYNENEWLEGCQRIVRMWAGMRLTLMNYGYTYVRTSTSIYVYLDVRTYVRTYTTTLWRKEKGVITDSSE